MDIVIGDVACRDQTDRRDMQARRAVGVRVTCRNAHHLLALKVNNFAVEFLGDRECCVDLSRKSSPPESLKKRRRKLALHNRDCLSRCHEPGFRKASPDRVYAKEMVPVTMCRIDRG